MKTAVDVDEDSSLTRVGGARHEAVHRAEHCRFYLPMFRLAFGDETTWGEKDALVAFAGRGREAEFFAPFCRTLTLTDNYEPCIAVLRQRYALADRPYLQVVQGDGRTLPVPDRSVDMAVALVALMHIRPLEIREGYAREFARILRPGGRVLLQIAQGTAPDVTAWEEPESVPEYTVGVGGRNVGFADEQAAFEWWGRYLRVEWMIRSRPVPPDACMRNWWWLIASREVSL